MGLSHLPPEQDPTNIGIDEFLAEARATIDRFETEWRAMHDQKPEEWPMEMWPGDWWEQLQGYAQTTE